jgi:hypothetical protein
MAANRHSWPGENLGAHYAGLAPRRAPKPEPPIPEEHLKRVRVAMEARERFQAACLEMGVVTHVVTERGQFSLVMVEPKTNTGKA